MVSRSVTQGRSASGGGAQTHDIVDAEDWILIQTTRANTLMHGPDALTRAAVESLHRRLATPVFAMEATEPWRLSQVGLGGTIVLHDVAALTRPHQQRLLALLTAAERHTQIISTTSRRLLPLVSRNDFHAALYYRLNMIFVDLETALADARKNGTFRRD